MSNNLTFYFTTRVGPEKKQIPFPANPSLEFLEIVEEVCKKFGVSMQTLSLATPTGLVLTSTEIMMTAQQIADKFGFAFEIIDAGVVGGS